MFVKLRNQLREQSVFKSILLPLLLSIFVLTVTCAYIFRETAFGFLPDGIQIVVLGLVLGALVIFFVNKYIKKTRQLLNDFLAVIVAPAEEQDKKRECKKEGICLRISEVEPVLNKLVEYIEGLRRLNSELESAKLNLSAVMEKNVDGCFVLNQKWEFVFINENAIKIMEAEDIELTGKCIWEVFSHVTGALTYAKMQAAMAQKEVVHWEAEGLKLKGKFYEYHAYPFVEGLSVFIRDITESIRQNQEYARLENLNLIGQLAAGLSHEIRNPLTTVKGFLQIFSSRPRYLQDKDNLALMISEIDRANGIIADFLSLSKPNSDDLKKQDLNGIIRQLYPLIQADAFNGRREVVLELSQLPDIMLNENGIKQLILNLVRNGLEVTPECGKIIVCTYLEGDRVVLAVKDQGSGIPHEIQDKIGTPFFTTKDNGTGLGLSISMGIAQKHEAIFDFQTAEKGTTFYIRFPNEGFPNEDYSVNRVDDGPTSFIYEPE